MWQGFSAQLRLPVPPATMVEAHVLRRVVWGKSGGSSSPSAELELDHGQKDRTNISFACQGPSDLAAGSSRGA